MGDLQYRLLLGREEALLYTLLCEWHRVPEVLQGCAGVSPPRTPPDARHLYATRDGEGVFQYQVK